MITGLHGLHVLGGVLVFIFLWGPGAALYKRNPEHLANRVEVVGLFWHFVDLGLDLRFPALLPALVESHERHTFIHSGTDAGASRIPLSGGGDAG